MRTLSIDIETYSSIDLLSSGVFRYAEAPDFAVLLFAYAYDDEPVTVIDIASGEIIPGLVCDDMYNKSVVKQAFNANFEITCLNRYFNTQLSVDQWECTSVHALMVGLPNNLGGVAEVLKLEQQKDKGGKALINYFSKPCKPTKANKGRTRNLPSDSPDKWEQFKQYCAQDVEVERAIKEKIRFYKIPAFEHQLWVLDQEINSRGMRVDTAMVHHAIRCDQDNKETLKQEFMEITSIDNPNALGRIKKWIEDRTGEVVKSLAKDAMEDVIDGVNDPDVLRVLEIRRELGKTSIAKYNAMIDMQGSDQRCRGFLQFYGANRTGRFAGRGIQFQNLPRCYLKDLDYARETLCSGGYDLLALLYGSVSDTLSQLIRTAFTASPGNRLIVADFNSIECITLAWLAGEQWVLDAFEAHKDIYISTASMMFGIPYEKIDKKDPLRAKGKVATLACGYQGGVGALVRMGALESGLKENELQPIVDKWRSANPRIVKYWKTVERAAIKAVQDRELVELDHGIRFLTEKGILFIQLPSGRRLSYFRARVEQGGKFGGEVLKFDERNGVTQKWESTDTYSGKLVENINQALARDCLAVALMRVKEAGYDIVAHVHDELICDVPMDFGSESEIEDIMALPIPWAKKLPLRGEAFAAEWYKK